MTMQDINLQVEQVFLNLPCSLWWMDRNHTYLGCNKECCGVTQLKPQEILGRNILDMAQEIDSFPFKALAVEIYNIEERIMISGNPEYDTRVVVPQGYGNPPINQLCARKPIVNIKGEVIGLLGAGILDRHYDIKMKEVLNALTIDKFLYPKSTIKIGFEQALEMTPCSIFWMDRYHKYIDCNQETCEVLGVSREEIIGKTILDVAIRKSWAKYKAQNIYDLDESIMYTGFPEFGIESLLPKQYKQPPEINWEGKEKISDRMKVLLTKRLNLASVRNWGAKKAIFNEKNEVIGLMGAAIYAGEFGSSI